MFLNRLALYDFFSAEPSVCNINSGLIFDVSFDLGTTDIEVIFVFNYDYMGSVSNQQDGRIFEFSGLKANVKGEILADVSISYFLRPDQLVESSA